MLIETRPADHYDNSRAINTPQGQSTREGLVGQTFLSALSAHDLRADRNVCPTVVRNTG